MAAISSLPGFCPRRTQYPRMITTGMTYCKTIALAALVSLLAMINRMEVATTAKAPIRLPFVNEGLKLLRERPKNIAAISALPPMME